MRSSNFIFILVLIALGTTRSFDFTSFVELEDLQNDPYGKSLIETIQMSMNQAKGGKIESIQALLDELLAKLNADQRKCDDDWVKEKKRLDTLIAKLESEITKLQGEIAGLEKEKALNEGKRAQSIKNIAQYKEQLSHDHATLKSLIKRRDEDNVRYQNSVREHAALMGAIHQVIDELSKLRGSVSGIGKPSHVRATDQEKRDANWKASQKAKLIEIIGNEEEAEAFLELATEADQAALEKLIALLRNILNQAQKSLNDDERHERRSLATYKKLRADLESDINQLKTTLAKQNANLADYIKKINQLIVTIKIRTDLLNAKKKMELQNTITERANKLNKYMSDKAKRDQERKVIDRVIKIVKERLTRMSQYLRNSVNK